MNVLLPIFLCLWISCNIMWVLSPLIKLSILSQPEKDREPISLKQKACFRLYTVMMLNTALGYIYYLIAIVT